MSSGKLPNKTLLAYMALIGATAIWGVATVVIDLSLNYIPVFTFLLFRFTIVGVIVLPPLIIALKRNPIDKKDIPNLILLGLTGQTSIALIFIGVKLSGSIDAALISILAPLLVVSAGHYFYRERVNRMLEIGIVLATAGTALVVLEPALSAKFVSLNGHSGGNNFSVGLKIIGNLFIISYNLAFANYIIWSKRIMGHSSKKMDTASKYFHLKPMKKRYSPFVHTSFTFFVALASFIPLAIIENLGVFGNRVFIATDLTAVPVLGILYMSVFSSIIAYFIFEWGINVAKVSDSAVFSYLGPLFTIPTAFILLGETPSKAALAGMAVIAGGVFIAEKFKS